ncbi:MAG TPA: hypothetical protein VJ951_02105 [Bacteroidales bacterium]|nr:hypothetical protein [Bacteroidales bacterium]
MIKKIAVFLLLFMLVISINTTIEIIEDFNSTIRESPFQWFLYIYVVLFFSQWPFYLYGALLNATLWVALRKQPYHQVVVTLLVISVVSVCILSILARNDIFSMYTLKAMVHLLVPSLLLQFLLRKVDGGSF